MERCKTILATLAITAACLATGRGVAAEAATVTPDQALTELKDGNKRFTDAKVAGPRRDPARRTDTAKNGQHPIVVVVGCSDSREPLELLFDQGIGDIFTIRVAGNVSNTDEIGSAEYGVGHLGAPLLLVLGHTNCGAVSAVCTHAEVHGSIPKLVAPIVPAVEKAQAEHPDLKGEALVPFAIESNVFQSMEDLLTKSEEVRSLVVKNKLHVEGAIYDIETGQIKWLGAHPKQQALIDAAKPDAEAKH